MDAVTNSSPPEPVYDPAVALENVIADETVDTEASLWARAELLAGREPGELVVELVSQSWSETDAEHVVEIARQETREARRVLTRESVVRDLNADYRSSTAGMSVAFCTGMFGLYGFTKRVMTAWRTLRRLSRSRANRN